MSAIRGNGEHYFCPEHISVWSFFAVNGQFAAINRSSALDIGYSKAVVLAVSLGSNDFSINNIGRCKARVGDRDHEEVCPFRGRHGIA